MTFSQGSALPDDYANGAFVGEHGSWNRDDFTGYKVRYIPFADGKPTGKAKDVVTGFIEGDQAHGRPVGVGIDGTGALLIADDAGNTVWRVAGADGTILSQPIGTDQMPPDSAVAAEAADNSTAPETQGQPSPSTDGQLTGQNPEQSKPKALPSQTEIAPAIKPSGTIEGTDQ